ncbi:SdiA-regulated domain-containing protein [Pseudomonas sp. R5(2019)]|uniref:SdiA-regulated domain-containing protein n=1 Tax=Pseudomonas sp. R5(2019) TaxID=2697566 RepID=UPI001412279E|nr:SdiA-regulated domain-containing protein [Pseudomonas sp. R5(2019)]NBA95896.1 DNA-binding protein [Pseudomonas sp. R5(2019)]
MKRALSLKGLWLCVGMAVLVLAVNGQQQRLYERIWFDWVQRDRVERSNADGVKLSRYRADVQALPLTGFDNLSALSFDSDRRTLVSLTNQNPQFIELSLDGKLLRSIPMIGFEDPEAIEYIRPGTYVVVEERRKRLTEIHIGADTESIDIADPLNARQLSLSDQDTENKGFEGLAYDPAHQRLYVAKEKNPLQILEISGFFGERIEPLNPNVTSNPARDARLFLTDLSSLWFDPASQHLLALSDESKVLIELDTSGRPVSTLTLRAGHQGLKADVMQAEGVAMDDVGNVYVVSEPNLFYRFKR